MGILGRMFDRGRPTITREEAKDFRRFLHFAKWWLDNDPLVKPVTGRMCTLPYGEGLRPTVKNALADPSQHEAVYGNPESLPKWFLIKVHLDLTVWLNDSSQDQFREYIDALDRQGTETLSTVGALANKFGLDLDNFVYERAMAKFPDDSTRSAFKLNYLTDTALGAEIRVLAWLYHQYFGEAYQLMERRGAGDVGPQ